MPDPRPGPTADTDRNLLFGVLALQADLLDAARFGEACSAWAGRTREPPAAGLCPYAAARLRLAGQLPGRWRKSGQGCRG